MIPHPNVYNDGRVCLSLLSSDWTPSISVQEVLEGIQDLFKNPNPFSPANTKMANLFKKDTVEYEKEIKKFMKNGKKKKKVKM